MSVNTAHANNGVLIHSGEWILLFSDNVTVEFFGQGDMLFSGTKSGRVYLTTHRVIFNSKNQSDPMQSFSFPFVAMHDIDIEQPVLGSNYIRGKVRAQPNGNWIGEAKFKIYFKAGGAIDFGQAMKRAAAMAQRHMHNDAPPPYTPPSGPWYQAPPPAYQPPPGYYGWIPSNDNFSSNPPSNTVFMSDNPPPYPGISGQTPQGFSSNGYAGYPGTAPPQPAYAGGAPQQPGYPGYGTNAPTPNVYPGYPGYPGGTPQTGFSTAPAPGGYPGYPGAPPGYPNMSQPGYPGHPGANAGYPGYPGGSAAPNNMGFTSGPSQNSKEAEAAQSAYYDPSRPQTAYVPPPAYYEPPPSYDAVSKKYQ